VISSASTFNFNCREAANSAPWFQEKQAAAWKEFSELPQPSRHDEMWRFANLKKTSLEAFHEAFAPADSEAIIRRSQGIPEVVAKLIFANDRLIYQDAAALPPGVVLVSLEEALEEHEELFREHFMKYEARLGSLKFAMLHLSQLRTGAFLYVPPGVVVEKPLEIWHWIEGDHSAIFPHTLLVAGKESHVSVVERFASVRQETTFACAMNDLVAEEGACLNYVSIQEWSSQTTAFHLNTTSVSKKGRATALQLHLGGHSVRAESDSRLLGKEAKSIMLSITPAHGTQEIDQRTFQDHLAPQATSDLLYHNALSDHARTIFSGLIKVEKEAHQTDAYQKVRNLMLSDEAEANSMPGLEILADDVRCTHGATSGELNEEELFYMMARGIPPQAATKLIVRGFFQTVLDRLEEPLLKSYLGELLDGYSH
jgi:Fe-S cluster assembly protein SufD